MSICKEKNGARNENAGAAEYRNIIAVTNRKLCERPFLEQVERICQIHPKALILREKDLSESAYEAMAGQVLKICGRYDTPCMLHSFVEVARRLHHPYIHLPLFLLEEYCGKLNDFRIVGSSIHSPELSGQGTESRRNLCDGGPCLCDRLQERASTTWT